MGSGYAEESSKESMGVKLIIALLMSLKSGRCVFPLQRLLIRSLMFVKLSPYIPPIPPTEVKRLLNAQTHFKHQLEWRLEKQLNYTL